MPGEAQASIRGIQSIPSITEINVRSGPGTNHSLIFQVPVGMSGLNLLEIGPDEEENSQTGKLYQWFKLLFHGGAIGWVRDDLLTLQGDARAWGYPDLLQPTWAFDLAHSSTQAPVGLTGSEIQPIGERELVEQPEVIPFTPAMQDLDRVRSLAFLITSIFEGRGYASYNNYDAGIVSYGFIQFTLASGALWRVIDVYMKQANSPLIDQFRQYIGRVQQRDPSLRHDVQFRDLLINAANERPMQTAQDIVATEGFWQAVVDGYITHRQLKMPLSWALLFDMGVNFGVNHGFVRLAEKNLGVQPRSVPGENGITEAQLITEVARLRKISHDRQAERDNLPGLKVRGDFWNDLTTQQDWGLTGDGQKLVVKGRMIETTQ
ncbi:MAG: SH3 domain-containing protein [Anaerolineae bacterium]|nr:SH3 domain-containing protein [Anaerolineae bacterium]